jgi:serine protease
MPVRVLDAKDRGTAHAIAQGIRWAAKHGADVINLSLSFPTCENTTKNCVKSCRDITGVCNAISEAIAAGVVVVAAAGNGTDEVTYPARFSASGLIAVGASALKGTRAPYSPPSSAVELLAPGGPADPVRCMSKPQLGAIVQVSFRKGDPASLCLQRRWGTSMAAAHVSGVAAMVIAAARAGGLGSDDPPSAPAQIEGQLMCTAKSAIPGLGGSLIGLGSGIADAAKAVTAACGTTG